jgi:carbonic anhydrase
MSSVHRVSRRDFVRLSGIAVGLAAGSAAPSLRAAAWTADKPAANRDPDAVFAQLLDGNKRFAKGEAANPRRKPEDFATLADGQAPLAAIVACADSRVAPELIFDQEIGDLFVVRVAGNVVSGAGASIKGSIEFAVAELGVRLVIVLGHSQCGAVKAAIKHIDAEDALPGAIGDIVDFIKPAVTAAKGKAGDKLENVIRANVERGVEKLKGLDPILAGPVKKGDVKVVGGSYDLSTGKVVFFN